MGVFSVFELVWAVWGISIGLVFWLTSRGLRCLRSLQFRRIALDEEGASYTLSYVMVIPLYILFMCFVVETTLLLLTKFGTNYAAYVGARSAIVHYSQLEVGVAKKWAEHAALQSFVPFANGMIESGTTRGDKHFDRYHDAYLDYVRNQDSGEAASEQYLRSKYEYTKKHFRVDSKFKPYESAKSDEPWLKDCSVTVSYDFAFHVPLVGRLLGGTWDADSKTLMCAVESTATLDSEAPKNNDESLGIEYEQWRNEQQWD